MTDIELRTSAFNIAHNRRGGGDAVEKAQAIYKFMSKGNAAIQAVHQANNTIPSHTGVDGLLEEAQRIYDFIHTDDVKKLPKRKAEKIK